MNNLNDPPEWNFRPDQRGGGDGWIWTKESQKEIGEVKAECDRDLAAVSSDLEAKYMQAVTESRRAAARVELELEKERQRARGFRQALHSQAQQLLEERKQLNEEREVLEEEKRQAVQRGMASTLLVDALERENEWQADAMAVLSQLETGLVERQSAYCNALLPRKWRLEMERNLLARVAKEPLATELNLESDLKDIFRNDRHCVRLTQDKRKNGSLMWLYLRFWQLQVTLQKHQRAQACLQGVKPKQK